MFIHTNILIVAALAALCSAAPTDEKTSPVVDSSPVGVTGAVICYAGTTWSGSSASYGVNDNSLNNCQSISTACVSSLWSISYRGTKCIKFYSTSVCTGAETYEVHANIQSSDQFQTFADIHGSGDFEADSYKVYNC